MKIIIPVLLILICLFLLVGCFDLPTPEQVVQSDANGKDVRKLAGDSASKTPLHTGRTTRAQVLALLGPPTYVSDDFRSIGYATTTIRAYLIAPLCFAVVPGNYGGYVLRLNFDDQDILQTYAIGGASMDDPIYGRTGYAPHEALGQALAKVNASGSPLRPIKQGPDYPPVTQP